MRQNLLLDTVSPVPRRLGDIRLALRNGPCYSEMVLKAILGDLQGVEVREALVSFDRVLFTPKYNTEVRARVNVSLSLWRRGVPGCDGCCHLACAYSVGLTILLPCLCLPGAA